MPTARAHVLDHSEPFSEAPAGLVVVDSNHPDYYQAVAEAHDGAHTDVFQLGSRYVDDQAGVPTKATVFEVPGHPTRTNPSITIGREFFVTALKDYSEWKEKWWREAIQNAVDAGAENIIMEVRQYPDYVEVSCNDDGAGMDEDVLLNKFLVLGGTTKRDPEGGSSKAGTAGGFGKAKELLVLPWLSWTVHTRDTIVEGMGIEYDVTKVPARVGTKLTVRMPLDNHTTSAHAISFVQKCYLPDVKFTVRDYQAGAAGGAAGAADPTVTKPKAAMRVSDDDLLESIEDTVAVYHVDSHAKTWNMYVRAKTPRGSVFMFSIFCDDVPGYLVAEIIAPSIKVLTANRDGFRDETVSRAISELGRRLAKDTLSALRRKKGMVRERFKGAGKFRAQEREDRLLAAIPSGGLHIQVTTADAAAVVAALVASDEATSERRPPGAINALGSPVSAPDAIATILHNTHFKGPDHVEAAMKQLAWEPDFYLINEIEKRTGTAKVPKKYWPETMTPTVRKLAKVWVELCRYVLVQLGSRAPYGVGFMFSNDAAAAHLREDGEHWLLLNPAVEMGTFGDTAEGGKGIWSPTDPAHLKWLYAAAIHEATHMADGISYHDEAFASALTKNMAHCADGFKHIKKIVAGIRMRGSAEADVDSD